MGFAISWVCLKGKTRTGILDMLELHPVASNCRPFESMYVGMDFGPRGYIVAINDTCPAILDDEVLRTLSRDCKAVTCQVEEHVMHAISKGWKDGELTWQVEHNCQIASTHLEISGRPPKYLKGIVDWADKMQRSDEDNPPDYIFEVPCLLAWRLTGFKHDRISQFAGSRPSEELIAPKGSRFGAKQPWWKIW